MNFLAIAFNVLVWLVIGYFILHVFFRVKPNSTGGTLTTGSGRQYAYSVGDNLYSYPAYGNFHGLDISLPFEMPHIYLDSLKAGGHEVGAVFDTSQRIALEGNFPAYFNVFVPNRYEADALSILTPDVMEVLQTYASDFDVEIYGSHLRVISNRKVLKDADLQDEMLEIADKILTEIEDRERSWTENNTLQAIDEDLLVYPGKGLRIRGRYMTWTRFWMSLFWLLCTFGIFSAGVYLIYINRITPGLIITVAAIAVYVGLQIFTTGKENKIRFWSRRK